MATTHGPVPGASAPTEDLPPPYAAVVGNPQFGFVSPGGEAFNPSVYQPPKQYTATGVYPHPTITVTSTQPQAAVGMVGAPQGVPVGIVLPPAVGTEPTTINCFNCNKVVTTRVTYTTAWHTHLVAGSVCVITIDRESVVFTREPPPPYTSEVPVAVQPTTQQRVIIQVPLKGSPTFYNCHKCGNRVLTKVEYVNTNKTHLCAGFICGFTCWCLMCCLAAIPYLVKPCKEALHYCPNCNTFLGTYSKF